MCFWIEQACSDDATATVRSYMSKPFVRISLQHAVVGRLSQLAID